MRRRFLLLVAPLVLGGRSLIAQDAPKPQPKRFEIAGTAGFSRTSGNANALTTNLGEKVKWSTKGWILNQDVAFFYGEADEKVNANFWNGGVRAERTLVDRVGVYAMVRFDRNVLQGVARRFEEGLGFDAKLVAAARDRLSVQVGASAFQLTVTPGSTVAANNNYPALRFGLDYKHNFSELAFVQQTAEYLPNLSDGDAYLVNSETALVAPLSQKLGLKFAYVVRYNAAPPVRNGVTLKTTDTFFSSGLTFSY